MRDRLHRPPMGMAEGDFIANANTCLQHGREQGDVWGRFCWVTLELSHHHQAPPELLPRMHETQRRRRPGHRSKGCAGCPPMAVGGSCTVRVRILYGFSENDRFQAQIFCMRLKQGQSCLAHFVIDPLSN